MRNEIAECILAQVAPPEQAATIVGDLLEEQLGPGAFWVAVLRTMASIAVQQPRRVLSTFFWFAFELGWLIVIYECMVDFYGQWHRPVLGTFVILALLAVFMSVHHRSTDFSQLAFTLSFIWMVKLDALPHWAIIFYVCAMTLSVPISWWLRWRRWKKSLPENDRPVAG